jgi:hypothetical protein
MRASTTATIKDQRKAMENNIKAMRASGSSTPKEVLNL